MIKPKEIEQGNLLKHKGDIIEVIAIDQFDFVWWDLRENTCPRICETIEIFEPIPLTEEWLIKFQLPKRKLRTPKLGCDYSIRNDFEVYCYIDKSGNCNFWGVNSFGCRFFIRKCDTVHDFQNIYTILNPDEELTIKMK